MGRENYKSSFRDGDLQVEVAGGEKDRLGERREGLNRVAQEIDRNFGTE